MQLTRTQLAVIHKIRQLIELDIKREIRVTDLAREFEISESILNKRFKLVTGETVVEYRFRKCMEKSLTMLGAGLQVKKVAIILGYHSIEAFSKAFKKLYGSPPSNFKAL